jgi:hypothetical protein
LAVDATCAPAGNAATVGENVLAEVTVDAPATIASIKKMFGVEVT